MTDKFNNTKIEREGPLNRYNFTDFFKGFDQVPIIKKTFGKNVVEILNNLEVEFNSFRRGYMGVSDDDGHLVVNTHHLKNSDYKILYLDVVHELIHVKQFMDGKDLFDEDYEYVDRPTEIEAYQITVDEAKKIGMNDPEIFDYLQVDWIDDESHKRLAKTVGIKIPHS
jgi:phage anti-repressor protein|tara:strand:+ start:7404 stop:7907 length:504 start_codon:yes stop_codon:yes gene_type:complete